MKWTCITKCYWLDRVWEAGEVYIGDQEPPHHFEQEGGKKKKGAPEDAAG